MKLVRFFGWTIHWSLQGLKLWLLGAVALYSVSPLTYLATISPLIGLADSDLNGSTVACLIVMSILCLIVSLAAFTAIFAKFLEVFPLTPYSSKTPSRPTQEESVFNPSKSHLS
jgi:hypothetical protein